MSNSSTMDVLNVCFSAQPYHVSSDDLLIIGPRCARIHRRFCHHLDHLNQDQAPERRGYQRFDTVRHLFALCRTGNRCRDDQRIKQCAELCRHSAKSCTPIALNERFGLIERWREAPHISLTSALHLSSFFVEVRPIQYKTPQALGIGHDD